MNREELKMYIDQGDEIEFEFQNKQFSITFGGTETNRYISFCEFYKEPINVYTIEELLNIKWDNYTVEEMLMSCKDEDICVF